MNIVFTYNLQITDSEEQAEFDSPETVRAIKESIQSLGHDVELVEVTGPASRIVARLEALNPQLIFNTAEGKTGRYREGFYPGLFDQIGLAYTGSDAYVCTLTLDKVLTKMTLATFGIPTPAWRFIRRLNELNHSTINLPVIVKPNFEGSSKGITQDSVVENESELKERVAALLEKYPAGIIIEEYIDGKDVTVPFLEAASPKTGGVLEPAEYMFNQNEIKNRKYTIYDYYFKNVSEDAVSVKLPAELTEQQARDIIKLSQNIIGVIGLRDFGRIDYRISSEGKIYFIEVNALPSLEPGASIYEAAGLAGLQDCTAVIHAILKSAARRYGIALKKGIRPSGKYRIGLTYNLKRILPSHYGSNDSEAEYDSPKTVAAIRKEIESYGHDVIELEATPELPSIIAHSHLDLVFNIAEGIKGRSRESQVPAILELLDIPYTGSDPATLSIALDKALAKRVIRHAGIPTPDFILMRTGKERLPRDFQFSVIIKPNIEGSSKGVHVINIADNEKQMREIAESLIARYNQPVLVERYLPGREFTVGLLGEHRPRVLPPMEIVFTEESEKRNVYSFEHKTEVDASVRFEIPAKVEPTVLREINNVAREAFMVLNCRDVARIDLRMNEKSKVYFIECNPLPGLTPGWSDLCIIAEKAGYDYHTLIGEIMAPAIRRFKQKRKQSVGS